MAVYQSPVSQLPLELRFMTWLRLLRVHHWVKNVLLAVPYLMAHAWVEPHAFNKLLVSFFTFSLVASASYILNDIADVSFDRLHVEKANRPLASGKIKAPIALVVAIFLAVLGGFGAWLVDTAFLLVVVLYAILTTIYTRVLKRLALLDVMALAALWALRLWAGAVAIGVDLSVWLLSFGGFLFLSLAMVKRCAELQVGTLPSDVVLPGRGYARRDLLTLQVFGMATSVMSVLVLALFVDSSSAQLRYIHHERLWFICPVLWFWLGRIWLMTGRGEMHHDPITFSLTDRVSWAAFLVLSVIWVSALMVF